MALPAADFDKLPPAADVVDQILVGVQVGACLVGIRQFQLATEFDLAGVGLQFAQ